MSADEDNDLRHRLAALEDEVQSLRNDDGATSTRRMMLKGGVAALGLGALATPSSAGTNQAGSIGGENATLDLWTEDLYIVEQGSTPSAPPSGYIDIYAKTDGNFYKLQSDGTESQLGGGGLSAGEDFDGQGTSEFTNLASVSTEDLNGAKYVKPGDPIDDINSKLSSPGLVVFMDGTHALSDRAEVTSEDVSILVAPGATVKIADAASPTTLSGGDGKTYTPVIYNSGHDGFHVENRGTIDCNQTNHPNPVGVFAEDANGPSTLGNGGEFVDHAAAVGVFDSTKVRIHGVEGHTNSTTQGCIWFEGIDGAFVSEIYCDGGEALDLNSACDNIQFDGLRADNSGEVVDVHSCSNVRGANVVAGSGCQNILTMKDTGTSIFTSEAPYGYTENVSIDGVRGTVSGKAIQIVGVGSGDLRGVMKVTGIDVVSTGDTAVSVRPDATDQFPDGLHLEGFAETESTGSHYGWGFNAESGLQQNGLRLDVEGVSAGSHGVVVGDWNDISGRGVGRDSAGQAVGLFTSGASVQNVELTAHGYNSDRGINIGGGCSDITVNGRAFNNSTADIVVGGSDVDVQADWDSRTDNGTRVVWSGLGYNAGDPNTTGDWNTEGREGVMVRDTANSNTYLFNDGSWSQIAST